VDPRHLPALPLRPDHAPGWKVFIPLTLVWIAVIGIWMQTPWNLWK
jgi:NADH:ubiquinone oxidoreductase subunit H